MESNQPVPEINGKPKILSVPLPEKIKDIIIDRYKQKQKLIQRYLQISINVDKGVMEKTKIVTELQNIDASISDRISEGFRKARLEKQKDYQWRFNGQDGFEGTLIEKTPDQSKK